LILYVDVVGGAAGDMLLAALLDAGAPREPVEEAIAAVLGYAVGLRTSAVTRGGLRALALQVPPEVEQPKARGPMDLIAAIEAAVVPEGVRNRATATLNRLGEAEARVHGVAIDHLRLEELGADDTLLDIVGIAAALDALGVDRIGVSAIPLPPGGHAHASHAPVTLDLLRGFAIRRSKADGLLEPVTPTAAAIFAALASSVEVLPDLTLRAVGVGAGRRDPASVPNVVRLLVGDPVSTLEEGR
jgi:uncharacterized protein (DUF111 family)